MICLGRHVQRAANIKAALCQKENFFVVENSNLFPKFSFAKIEFFSQFENNHFCHFSFFITSIPGCFAELTLLKVSLVLVIVE